MRKIQCRTAVHLTGAGLTLLVTGPRGRSSVNQPPADEQPGMQTANDRTGLDIGRLRFMCESLE